MRKPDWVVLLFFGVVKLVWSVYGYGWLAPEQGYAWGMIGGAGCSLIALGFLVRFRRFGS
jgi:hypothetical protein